MPGNVQNAVYSGTLPWSLSTSFTETREWAILIAEYKDGSSQRNPLAETSRKKYAFSKRLTAAQMTTLRNFFISSVGKAFKVYTKKSDYDAANSSFKLMRFDGGWSEEIQLGRSTTSIQLVELA